MNGNRWCLRAVPELPEVETVRRSLIPVLAGRTVLECRIVFAGSIHGNPDTFRSSVQGEQITDIARRGKYLAFCFASGAHMAMHLRMTGQAIVRDSEAAVEPHCRVRFVLDDGRELRFVDMRKFGRITWLPSQSEWHDMVDHLGPEPLTESFTVHALRHAVRGRRAIKSILLDQTRVAGLGNIYADEALFRARLHPERRGSSLTKSDISILHGAIEQTLHDALTHGGTTIRDYVQGDGRPGEYAAQLRVYGRAGKPCCLCGTVLARSRVAGRGTVHCPRCQRSDDGI